MRRGAGALMSWRFDKKFGISGNRIAGGTERKKLPKLSCSEPAVATATEDSRMIEILAATPSMVYLNCDQAGAHLNLSPRTLEKMRTIGGGPRFRKLGRRVVYTLADLDAWADARACESTSDAIYHRK